MRTAILAFLLLALAASGGATASADEYKRGIAAGNRGDFATAMQALRPLADAGDPRAQFAVGQMFQRGYGVDPDPKQALKWYRRSAESGNANAQTNLGVMYANGIGVSQNLETAEKWFLLAAEQGNPDAQANLGVIYRRKLASPSR